MELCDWFLALDWGRALEYVFKVLGALIAWLLVVTGWAVANDLTAQREMKKLQDQKIQDLRKRLDEIEELAVNHHTETFDERRAQKIVRRMKLIGLECSHLERTNVLSMEWRAANLGIRRAVTLKNFESGEHNKLARTAAVISEIESAFDSFQTFLMRSLEAKLIETERLRDTLRRMLRRL